MARRWVVLTVDRATGRGAGSANEIIEYTEWAGRPRGADEVIYTDPVDSGGDPVDAKWHVGGTVTLAGGVYTYTEPPGQLVPDDLTTDTGRKRAAVRAALEQLDRWDASLRAAAIGQPSVNVSLGHDLILGQRKALYRRSVVAGAPAAAIESYAEQISRGSSDITTVATFYRLASALTKGTWFDGDPLEWATQTGVVATRRTLQAAITAAPTDFRVATRDFSSIDLSTDAWVGTAIT